MKLSPSGRQDPFGWGGLDGRSSSRLGALPLHSISTLPAGEDQAARSRRKFLRTLELSVWWLDLHRRATHFTTSVHRLVAKQSSWNSQPRAWEGGTLQQPPSWQPFVVRCHGSGAAVLLAPATQLRANNVFAGGAVVQPEARMIVCEAAYAHATPQCPEFVKLSGRFPGLDCKGLGGPHATPEAFIPRAELKTLPASERRTGYPAILCHLGPDSPALRQRRHVAGACEFISSWAPKLMSLRDVGRR